MQNNSGCALSLAAAAAVVMAVAAVIVKAFSRKTAA